MKIEGEFISRVFVSRETGYCEKVRQTVSQYLGWFSRTPRMELVRSDGEISKVVVQPYYHGSKPCELPAGEHLVRFEYE